MAGIVLGGVGVGVPGVETGEEEGGVTLGVGVGVGWIGAVGVEKAVGDVEEDWLGIGIDGLGEGLAGFVLAGGDGEAADGKDRGQRK